MSIGAGAERLDARRLERDLSRGVEGEVRFDEGSRALYSMDASNYREVPIGVVVPRSVDGIAAAVEICARHKAPVLHRGGGTSLAGQCTNRAVVIDSSKYCNSIRWLDPDRRLAYVEPGVRLDRLRAEANQHGLTFGPDPSTHGWNTLGGMIGNNSGGVHSVTAGLTIDNVEWLDVMTYDGLRLSLDRMSDEQFAARAEATGREGQIFRDLASLRDRYADLIRARFPKIPRRVSGYALNELLDAAGPHPGRALVGSEGTCVTVLGAALCLIPEPAKKVLLVLGFADVFRAADAVPHILEHAPLGIEGVDERLVDSMRRKGLHVRDLKLLPEGGAWLIVQFGGSDSEEAMGYAHRARERLAAGLPLEGVRVIADDGEQHRVWLVRESGLGATAFVPGSRDTWPGWEDSAVHPDELGSYIRDLRALMDRYGYYGALYGHFGDGLIHTRIDFGLHSREEIDRYRRFLFDAAELVTAHGGSLSGEHGDGQSRAELLKIMYGPELVRAFEEFKRIWDPQNRMNPGRVVNAPPVDVDLRMGPRLRPKPVETQFAYRESGSSFARAVHRCVGVGKCRRVEGGTMCPSFRATREERHTTRGRAHLLQEMLYGDPVTETWRSKSVFEALDLCLSCKACKSDCPVQVDMATYRAEFLSHYYRGRLRPVTGYSLGLVHVWARLAAHAPGVANLLTHAPGLAGVAKALGGIHPARELPRFAARTFRKDFVRRNGRGGKRAILWTDTFNNHFRPEALRSAAEIIEEAGYEVELLDADLCCGRPFFDFGRLDRAKQYLARIMEALEAPLSQGAFLVGVEPSCMATFRDELPNLFPDDDRARLLSERSMLLAEFLCRFTEYEPPRLDGLALLRGHCIHKAIFGLEHDRALLERTGLELLLPDDGCCGMAGAFGYERRKYEVSLAIAKDAVLPAIRRAGPDTDILCDGFSCSEQIRQTLGAKVLTLAEFLRQAREGRPSGADGRIQAGHRPTGSRSAPGDRAGVPAT